MAPAAGMVTTWLQRSTSDQAGGGWWVKITCSQENIHTQGSWGPPDTLLPHPSAPPTQAPHPPTQAPHLPKRTTHPPTSRALWIMMGRSFFPSSLT